MIHKSGIIIKSEEWSIPLTASQREEEPGPEARREGGWLPCDATADPINFPENLIYKNVAVEDDESTSIAGTRV